MQEEVVLVDTRDTPLGTLPKLQAHREARLHRAISVFVFNDAGELLLQRRAAGKYHSPGLWSNSCCSHPRPGEQPHAAAIRRIREEMGLDLPLDYAFSFIYKAQLADDLWEHELDHVFIGESDRTPTPDPDEVGEWRWSHPDDIEAEMRADPSRYTVWFPLAFGELQKRRDSAAGPQR